MINLYHLSVLVSLCFINHQDTKKTYRMFEQPQMHTDEHRESKKLPNFGNKKSIC
ncbi:hypothetical protein FIS3754_48030 [Fischerella sp. NIES-3754]|nr:hypothetical protein FIS3754_48030 [Fischerella sp. NIES-3754]BCX06316.1 MAG: hypothetical protein KatS3mg066_0175 [Fischerella sp.]